MSAAARFWSAFSSAAWHSFHATWRGPAITPSTSNNSTEAATAKELCTGSTPSSSASMPRPSRCHRVASARRASISKASGTEPWTPRHPRDSTGNGSRTPAITDPYALATLAIALQAPGARPGRRPRAVSFSRAKSRWALFMSCIFSSTIMRVSCTL